MKSTILFISCEHGGNDIPPSYQHLFAEQQSVLDSHLGFDFGSLSLAKALSETCECRHTFTTTSRLLVDCNRSKTNPRVFSEFTNTLPKSEKQNIINHHYLPYRNQAEGFIQNYIEQGSQVLHLSMHTFTPVFNSITRNAAIGLLYDPSRHGEKEVARLWYSLLTQYPPSYRIRMNYPYRGGSDGFTSSLRKKYTEEQYLGIEVETNQAILQDPHSFAEVQTILSASLKELLQLL